MIDILWNKLTLEFHSLNHCVNTSCELHNWINLIPSVSPYSYLVFMKQSVLTWSNSNSIIFTFSHQTFNSQLFLKTPWFYKRRLNFKLGLSTPSIPFSTSIFTHNKNDFPNMNLFIVGLSYSLLLSYKNVHRS